MKSSNAKKIQEVFNLKREQFSKCSDEMYQNSIRNLEMLQGRRKLEVELRARDLEAKQQASNNARQKRHQKLKDDHMSLAKLSDARLKEATLKDKQEQEAAQKRKEEFQAKIDAFVQCKEGIYTDYQEIASLIKSCRNLQLLSTDVRQATQVVHDINNAIHKIVGGIRGGKIEQKDIDLVSSFRDRVASSLAIIKSGVELVNRTVEEEEAARNAPVENPSLSPPVYSASENIQNAASMPANPVGVSENQSSQSSTTTVACLKHYLYYMELLEKNTASYQDLVINDNFKKYRFDLKKAINTPVNAISSQSSSHLRDKLERLAMMLAGQPVDVGNKRISISDHPQGRNFCLDILAKKFVKQGEEQVASSHTAVFPIAAVIVGLWSKDAAFGELLLAHFYTKCPFLVPYFLSRQTGQSDEEYYVALGYNISDGVLEQSNSFLKRMTGIVRLYAAILQSVLPRGILSQHPHGLENGWRWLAQVLNTDPLPDITATVLFDFLEVCGHRLHQQYSRQFLKILLLICQDYFSKIRSVTPPDSGGPFSRLETFLQKCLRQGHILPPEGMLSEHFWRS